MATRSKLKAERRQEQRDIRPKAVARYIRMSPFKVRQVLDLVRGKSYGEAVAILENTPRIAAPEILKVLKSAGANAENNPPHFVKEDLVVAEVFADQGPTLKRVRPRARGSAFHILKRTSHITVILGEEAAK